MQGLSSELQLLVISYLYPIDIYCLEQTCKELRGLIQDFSGAIWKECLLRQCLLNGIFWPSFQNLTEPAQFKLAATSGLRFIKTCETVAAASAYPLLSAQRASVSIQTGNEELHDFYLVQGGRFLITLEHKRIAMWDISQSQTPDHPNATLVWSYDNQYGAETLQATRIIDATAILLVFTLKTPRNHPDFENPDPSYPNGRYSTEYFILEICPDNSDQGFEVRGAKFLCITAPFPATAGSFTFFTDTILLNLENSDKGTHTFIVWDYVRDEVAYIRFESDQKILGTILRQNHLFNVFSGGVDLIELPPLQPTKEGCLEIKGGSGCSGLSDFGHHARLIASCSYEGGEVRVGRWEEWAFTGPDILNPSHLEDHSLVYELMEDVHGLRNRFNLRHYAVRFDPACPQDSTVVLTGKYEVECGGADYDCVKDVKPVFTRICEGRNAALWIDDDAYGGSSPTQYLAIYPSAWHFNSTNRQESPKFVEFKAGLPNYRNSWEYLYELCPVSGTLAVLKNDTVAGMPYIRCYRLLEDDGGHDSDCESSSDD